MQHEMQEFSFDGPCLLFFSPFHPFRLVSHIDPEGMVLQFSSEFYWFGQGRAFDSTLYKLFRNVDHPVFPLNEQDVVIVENQLESIVREFEWFDTPSSKMICSYVKSLLIHSLRIQSELGTDKVITQNNLSKDYQLLKNLNCLIHQNYKTLKRPAEYAELLNITPSALTKAARKNFGRTVTELIQKRILEEARRELALNGKSVKEVAAELGYDDQYYFSRLFKKVSGISPDEYKRQMSQFLYG